MPSAVLPGPSTVVGLLSGFEGVVEVHPLTSIFTQPPTAGWGRSDQNRMERTMQKGPQTVRASNGSIAVGWSSCTSIGDSEKQKNKTYNPIPSRGRGWPWDGGCESDSGCRQRKKVNVNLPYEPKRGSCPPAPSVFSKGWTGCEKGVPRHRDSLR